jgi:hypothetical protein
LVYGLFPDPFAVIFFIRKDNLGPLSFIRVYLKCSKWKLEAFFSCYWGIRMNNDKKKLYPLLGVKIMNLHGRNLVKETTFARIAIRRLGVQKMKGGKIIQ